MTKPEADRRPAEISVSARKRKRLDCSHWLVNRETKTCVKVGWQEKSEPGVYFAESAEAALRKAGVKL